MRISLYVNDLYVSHPIPSYLADPIHRFYPIEYFVDRQADKYWPGFYEVWQIEAMNIPVTP